MPIPLSPNRQLLTSRSADRLRRYAVLITGLALLPVAVLGQTLARPGWAGSGLTLQPWWTHAVLYEIDPHGFNDSNGDGIGDLRGAAKQLDYVHSVGVDAIALTHLSPAQGDTVARSQSVDPALGTLDDFDDFVREASRDNLRILVELDPQQISDPAALANVARFWLSRGVAGISLRSSSSTPADSQQQAAQIHKLRDVTKSFAGQRILVAEGEGADLTLNPGLAGISTFSAEAIHPVITRLQNSSRGSAPVAATDGYGIPRSAARLGDGSNDAAIAKVLAAVLLATHANAQLYFGQEIGMTGQPGASSLMPWGTVQESSARPPKVDPARGAEVAAEEADPDSLLNWYRRLIDLHHGNAALRSGTNEFLNHDADNSLVWVSRPQTVTPLSPAIIVACNLSNKPVTLSLVDDMRNTHLRGSFLRTVLRSDAGMGGMNLNALKLPPHGIYIGELRF